MARKVVPCFVAGYRVDAVPGEKYTIGLGGNCWGPIPLGEATDDMDTEGIFEAVPIGKEIERKGGGVRMDVDSFKTTYSSNEKLYKAIQVPWDLVERIIGRPHDVSEADDEALMSALLRSGDAPEWVRDSVCGWTDEHGWGIIGPAKEGGEKDD